MKRARKTLDDLSLPHVSLFASGGVAVELAKGDKQSLENTIEDITLCLELGADLVQLYTTIHKDYTRLGVLVNALGKKLEKEGKTFNDLKNGGPKPTNWNKPIYRLFQINQDTCIGCGICARTAYCDAIKPTEKPAAINKKLTTYEIHPNDCTGCGVCVKVCPVENTIVADYKNSEKAYES